MTDPNSTPQKRPRKPYPDYPLTPRVDGRWQKKIRGKVHYFTGTWEEALNSYLEQRDFLAAGLTPPDTDGVTLEFICNDFLHFKKGRVDRGDLKQRTWDEYAGSCKRLVRVLGRTKPAAAVQALDFVSVRADMEKTLGPTRVGNEINRIRSVFKYAVDHGHLDRPPRYGHGFDRPNTRVLRRQRREKGSKLFTPDEIKVLIEHSSVQMRAMVYLGINAGFGNADCGQLEFKHLNLATGWFDFPRPKTEVDRRGKLWPETVDALRANINERKPPNQPELQDRVFVTKRGLSWFKDTPDNPVSKEFRKLADATGIYRPALTFYSLRHTFETIAGDTGDQVATNYVMGHSDQTMAATYREAVFNARLEKIASHVREWLSLS